MPCVYPLRPSFDREGLSTYVGLGLWISFYSLSLSSTHPPRHCQLINVSETLSSLSFELPTIKMMSGVGVLKPYPFTRLGDDISALEAVQWCRNSLSWRETQHGGGFPSWREIKKCSSLAEQMEKYWYVETDMNRIWQVKLLFIVVLYVHKLFFFNVQVYISVLEIYIAETFLLFLSHSVFLPVCAVSWLNLQSVYVLALLTFHFSKCMALTMNSLSPQAVEILVAFTTVSVFYFMDLFVFVLFLIWFFWGFFKWSHRSPNAFWEE